MRGWDGLARTLVALHEVGQAAGASSMDLRSILRKTELTSTRPDTRQDSVC